MCSECAGAPWSSALSASDLFPAHPFCPAGLPRTDEAPHLKAPSVIVSHGLQANSQDKIEEALSWEMLLGSKEKQSSPRRERNSFRLGRSLRCGAWLLRGCARWCLATEGLLRLVPGTDGRNSAASRSCVLSAPGDGLSREVCRRGTNVQVLPGDSVRLVCPRRCIGKGTPPSASPASLTATGGCDHTTSAHTVRSGVEHSRAPRRKGGSGGRREGGVKKLTDGLISNVIPQSFCLQVESDIYTDREA